MPRKVDHQLRRRQIAEALWRVTGRDGLEAVSLRKVAAEAGVSMGMVQHYFTTKDEMLQFAFDAVSERVAERIGRRAADLPDPEDPRGLVRTLLIEMLPLDPERRLEAQVGFAYFARAGLRPRFAARLNQNATQFEEFLAEQVRRARRGAGEQRHRTDPVTEAILLRALVDGLSAHAVAGLHAPEVTVAVLDAHLQRVFDDH